MAVFGWIIFSLLSVFGLGILVIFTIPFIVTEFKMMNEKIKRSIADKKYDLDKRSEERRNRDAIKRERDFELANRKLDTKLQKVDKQIEIHQKKLELVKQLKEQTATEKEELNKSVSDTEVKTTKIKVSVKATNTEVIEQEPQSIEDEILEK